MGRELKKDHNTDRYSYEFYKTVLNGINDSICIIDTDDLSIVSVNDAFLKEYGLTEKDVIGKKCHEITHNRQTVCLPPYDPCPLNETLRTGAHAAFEHIHYTKRGERIYVEVSAHPLKDNKGRVIQAIHVSRNITHLKETENSLRKKQDELLKKTEELTGVLKNVETIKKEWETTMDCIEDMVMIVDKDDKIQRCNMAVRKFTAKTYDEILGKNWKTLLMEHGIKFGDENIYHYVKRDIEFVDETKGGWFSINSYPYKILSGEKEGSVITVHDTTEIKTLMESLKITNEVLEKDRKELQLALDEISFLMQEVRKRKDISVRFNTSDFSGSDVIFGIAGHFNEMMAILESQHKELENAYSELKSAQSQLLQSEKMASIGQLAAGVAHEINNPVGFIMSNLGSLQRYIGRLSEFIKAQTEAIGQLGVTGSEFEEIQKKVNEFKKSLKIDYIMDDLNNLIKESLDGAERVKKIVQDLKSFSRVDEAEWKMADINSCIESTINIVWNELKYKATIKKEYGNIPLTKCNPGQLNQVFMNMLVNAAYAIEKQGEITIKTWLENGYIYVSISDTGCGIPADKINRIFEPFFTTKEVGKGTGLGLSIAYDIMKKHNGEINVESEAGKGTTFTVKIPVVER
ncbi:MAG: PAS domain-containing protein [Nitrospirota bacterium]